jgi:hypothetical protein
MRTHTFTSAAFLLIAASWVASGVPAAASASSGTGPSTVAVVQVPTDSSDADGVIEVCEGQTLNTLGADGDRLDESTIRLNLASVRRMCAGDGASVETSYNVVAHISYNSATNTMGVSAYANSLPYATYALSCIYRDEPVSGKAGSWSDCGVVRGKNTYFTTRGNYWCPVPGTRWHVNATLFDANEKELDHDDAWKVAG